MDTSYKGHDEGHTRTIFRFLFNFKVICLLPLYIKFAGAICRYLRRWLEADEVSAFAALKSSSSSKPQKGKKKDEVKTPMEEERPKKKDDTPAVMVFKIDRDGIQEIRRTPSGDHKFTPVNDPAYLERAGFPWPQMAVPFDEFRSRHEDPETQAQDRIMREAELEVMQIQKKAYMEDKQATGARMVVIGDSLGSFDREAFMGKTVEDITSKFKTTESKSSERKTSKEKKSGGKTSVEKMSEEKKSEEKTSEVKISEVKISEVKIPEEKTSEKKTSQGGNGNSIDAETSEEKSLEEKSSKTSEDLSYPERGTSKARIAEDLISESKTSFEKITERNSSEEKNQSEDGVVEMECDSAADDRLIKETFPELHLGEPHPNEVYDDMVQSKWEKKEKLENSCESDKRRLCAFCKSSEIDPKSFKKCQK